MCVPRLAFDWLIQVPPAVLLRFRAFPHVRWLATCCQIWNTGPPAVTEVHELSDSVLPNIAAASISAGGDCGGVGNGSNCAAVYSLSLLTVGPGLLMPAGRPRWSPLSLHGDIAFLNVHGVCCVCLAAASVGAALFSHPKSHLRPQMGLPRLVGGFRPLQECRFG